jgi:hypothetical protein
MDASANALVPAPLGDLYEVREYRNAIPILHHAHAVEWGDIVEILTNFRFHKSEIVAGGGAKTEISKKLDDAFTARGWREKKLETKFSVDGTERTTETHKIDCYKGRVGLEIEWNSKDQTFVRDLNNFRVLFDWRVLDVGVIVTRSDDLQRLFQTLDIGGKYGASTTHMGKLIPRLESGGSAGCPVLAFGITQSLYDANR